MIYVAVCLIGVTLQALFIVTEQKEKYVPAVLLKGSASLAFVILGLLTSKKAGNEEFARLVVIGLILGMAGDVLLNLRYVFPKIGSKIFLAGIAAFLAGHVVYLCALIPLSNSLKVSLICGAVAAVALLAWIFSKVTAKPAFKIFGVFYIGAIVLMTAVAVGNCVTSGFHPSMLLYAVGAISFTISDVVLIFNTFTGSSTYGMRIANLSFYYAGQLLIALSLLFA